MIVRNQTIEAEQVGAGVERKILATAGGLMAVEVCFQKGGVGTIHSHPHEQISYIVKGSFEFILEGKKEVIEAGDSYYVSPGAPHGVVALEDSIILDVFTPQREDLLKKR